MKSANVLFLALFAFGCRPHAPLAHNHRGLQRLPGARGRDSLELRDSSRSTLRRPRVITAPTMIVFWLGAADTLSAGDASSAYDDLTYYTDQVTAELKQAGIAIVPTTADTVYVEGPAHHRRMIVLSGLDYPYGYVLLDPGGPERILTGIYSDDDLLDEIEAYFNIDSDSTKGAPRVAT
ncbi:MAG TPA: hypothetical protein VEV39_13770 [Gemmatimonadales bacterium]|nr:hypothetical protein [Gemmatimonadales bacterium]